MISRDGDGGIPTITSLKLSREIAKLLHKKKCTNVIILNVRKLTTFTDYFVVATVLSKVQMKVALDTVLTGLKQKGIYRLYRNQSPAEASTEWQTIDYGGVVVHIMSEYARNFYCLERLWYKAHKVAIKPIAKLRFAATKK